MSAFKASFRDNNIFNASFSNEDSFNARFGNIQRVETDDYEKLYNKPSIEDVTLVGNKTFKQLGLEAATVQEVEEILYLG